VGGLPALTGFAPPEKVTGEMMSMPQVVLGLSVIRAFEHLPDLMQMLSEVNLERLGSPRVILAGGTVVELGQGGYAEKVGRLGRILFHTSQLDIHASHIDLRFGRQVAVRCDKMRRGSDKEV
jgi:hypothetical protein